MNGNDPIFYCKLAYIIEKWVVFYLLKNGNFGWELPFGKKKTA